MQRSSVPLATRMRPGVLDDFYGQDHLLSGEGGLMSAIERGDIPSLIFWGPPGTGKTTLAHIIASRTGACFVTLSAVTDGVKELRKVVSEAEQRLLVNQLTILFVDEVHRFNKAQQDALLPHIERGTFVFIGATTENPSFEINNALLSRVAVYRLELLSEAALTKIIRRALSDSEKGWGESVLKLGDEHIQRLAEAASGDARAALNTLDMLGARMAQQESDSLTDDVISQLIETTLSEKALHFDKGGDHFYDQISALHKAVRGSSPDAALYWLARMICSGCDPLYVARRMIRMATEDIGVADPRALRVALDGWEAMERLGSPEGDLSLAQVAVYLSVAPKSNAVYKAWKSATALAKNSGTEPVPVHLRNAPTRLMKEMGHGANYRYAHDYPDAYVPGENYLPDSLRGTKLYEPVDRGLELKIRQKLQHWASLDNNE